MKKKRNILIGIACVVFIGLSIFGYKTYQNYQNEQAEKVVSKAYHSTGALSQLAKGFQLVNVDRHKKIINLQLTEWDTHLLEQNVDDYFNDNVSIISRLTGENDQDSAGGNLNFTFGTVEPICDAIATNKSFVNQYGRGWTINVYTAQGKHCYQYQDDKFLFKPEIKLKKQVAQAQAEHDENVAELTKSFFDALSSDD